MMDRIIDHLKVQWDKRLQLLRTRKGTKEEKDRRLSTSKKIILIVIRQNISSTGVCALFQLLLAFSNARVTRL